MTPEERRAFLSEGTRTGKLAVTDAHGAPHVVPVWFVLDGDDVLFNCGASSLKARAIARDPRVALVVDEEVPPYAFVLLKGEVEVSDDVEAMLSWSTRIGGRYMGDDRAAEFGRRNAVEGELLIRLRPTRIVARISRRSASTRRESTKRCPVTPQMCATP